MKSKEIEHADSSMRRIILHRREILVAYLEVKTEENDWHAVSDAANDLREIDAKLEMLDGREQ